MGWPAISSLTARLIESVGAERASKKSLSQADCERRSHTLSDPTITVGFRHQVQESSGILEAPGREIQGGEKVEA